MQIYIHGKLRALGIQEDVLSDGIEYNEDELKLMV